MSDYRIQQPVVIFDEVTLTTDFDDNRYELAVDGMEKLSLDINYDANDASNVLEMTVEHSTNGTDWYSLVIDDTATVSDITAREWNITGSASLNVLLDIAYKNVRVSIKETVNASTAGSATIVAMPSGR